MDNQEAIRLIRKLPTMCEFTDAYGEPIDSDAYYEAVDIAISALHAQDVPDINVGDMKTQLSAEGTTNLQPTCNRLATDTISRQEAKPRYIDANEIPYCEVLDADTHKGTGRFMADKKDIDALPSVQTDGADTNVGTMISRQAAIDEAEEWIETYNSGRGGQRERDAIKHVISGIKKLPSVQPERKECEEREQGKCPWYAG